MAYHNYKLIGNPYKPYLVNELCAEAKKPTEHLSILNLIKGWLR